MYKHQIKRDAVKKEFKDIEDYLSSLELKVVIFEDDDPIIPRMSQMTQKTNQFNLTTQRYTEGDIQNFIANKDSKVFALSAADKFGDYGITGLCIITGDDNIETAEIDTLLMSCRIIGRNIEYAFMDYLIRKMKEKKVNNFKTKYIKTQKNEQVKEFYDKCGFKVTESNDSEKKYTLDLTTYVQKKIDYIGIVNGK